MRLFHFSAFIFILSSEAKGRDFFEEEIEPLLQSYCFKCHGEKKQKGDLRLDGLDPNIIKGVSVEEWHDALNKINLGEMPPEDEPQFSVSERRKIVDWLTGELQKAAKMRQGIGGQFVMRRINRAEYQLSLIHI